MRIRLMTVIRDQVTFYKMTSQGSQEHWMVTGRVTVLIDYVVPVDKEDTNSIISHKLDS